MPSKVDIGNPVTMGRLLEFEIAFPGEKPLTPKEYMAGGNRDYILNVAALFLGFKAINSKYRDNRKLLSMIFSEENRDFSDLIYSRIELVQRTGVEVGIINSYNSLKLFECFFENDTGEVVQANAEFERNLFKAYLVLNSEFIKIQNIAFSSTNDLVGHFKLSMMMFCMAYPVADKSNFDISEIWTTQIIKSIYLFTSVLILVEDIQLIMI